MQLAPLGISSRWLQEVPGQHKSGVVVPPAAEPVNLSVPKKFAGKELTGKKENED